MLLLALVGTLALAGIVLGSSTATAVQPTCSGTLGIAVHGQHIVGDYITGLAAGLTWPPSGGVVGSAIAGSGAVTPGGPGPGFHFIEGFSPGASFCLDQSQAPGVHLGP